MRNYLLCVSNRKNDYYPIEFSKISGNEKLNFKSLMDVDKFTMQFSNVEELSLYLINHANSLGIEPCMLASNYNIVYKDKGIKKSLKNGLAFSDTKKYLIDDEIYLLYCLKQAVNEPDKELLRKICSQYRNNPIQSVNINCINEYLKLLKQDKPVEKKYPQEAIFDFFTKEVYKYDSVKKECMTDPKTGEILKDYRPFRDLALIVSKHYAKKTNNVVSTHNFVTKSEEIIDDHPYQYTFSDYLKSGN